jgi:pimeloyl-ACP methyl ester carboxylesterase
MKPASEFHQINGLRYHVQRWGQIDHKKVFLLHGFGDCGLSFQFLAEQMLDLTDGNLDIVAPDWRGFGRSEYAPSGYWFPDYYADLDALLNLYSAVDAVTLIGHSMGGNIACMYAGIRPDRVAHLVAVDGLGLPPIEPGEAPGRFATWLNELQQEPSISRYSSIDELAERLGKRNTNMDSKRARFVADSWMRYDEAEGDYVLRSDPGHKRVNPMLYRHEEMVACWRRITARMLAVTGDDSAFSRCYKETGVFEQLAGMIGDFESAVIAEAGHMIHHEQPEALAAKIMAWLEI